MSTHVVAPAVEVSDESEPSRIESALAAISKQFDDERRRLALKASLVLQYPKISLDQVWTAIPWLLVGGQLDQEELCKMSYPQFLKTLYWKAVSHHAKQGHPWCHECAGYLEELHVHHKTYVRRGLEWRNPEDLVVLCHACHEDAHASSAKSMEVPRKPPARVAGVILSSRWKVNE